MVKWLILSCSLLRQDNPASSSFVHGQTSIGDKKEGWAVIIPHKKMFFFNIVIFFVLARKNTFHFNICYINIIVHFMKA